MKIKIKKLHPDAVIPTYTHIGDAGMDLTACAILSNTTFQVTYDTGIALEIPDGHVGLVFPRSSIRDSDLYLSNSVAVLDAKFRGNIQVTFNKTAGLDSIKYKVGERIAQLIILPFPQIEFEEVTELSETIRGTGGFGSSGR